MEFFQYEPIIHDEHGFRIVRLLPGAGLDIEVEIIHASFDESHLIEYDAVSYVWGSPELTRSIIAGGKRLNVTQNLELVLRDLRLPEDDRYLWIDGICIDQEKDKERNHQVRQMGAIYQRAELVLFHLGRSNDLTLVVQETFEIYQEQHKLRPEMTFESVWVFVKSLLALRNRNFETEIRQALRTILAAPWFRRVWIIQEVANARRALLHWGPAALPIALFVQLVRDFGIETDHRQSAILDMMPRRRRSKSQWSSQQDLYHLLKDFRGAEASHDHDKIFAMVGMCAGGKGHGTIAADYSKGLDIVIREAIAYMGFCDADDIDVGFRSMSQLFNDVDSLLEHLLVHLAENERLASLKSLLLNRGDELNITDTILSKAFARDNRDVIRLLLPYAKSSLPFTIDWAEVLETPTSELTPLWQAVLRDEMNLITHLLANGADANTIAPTGLSPIGWAAMEGKEDVVKILCNFKADVEAGFHTPLFLAAKHGKLKIVEILLEDGANIESRDHRGRTPLSIAASAGNESILSGGLSKAGIKAIDDLIDQRNQCLAPAQLIHEQIMTSLRRIHWPNHRHRLEPTTWRLAVSSQEGADTYRGDVPCSHLDLELSGDSRAYSEVVNLLVERGADVHSDDMFGLTPLWWAVNWGHPPIVGRLLQNKVFFRHIENGGALMMTPLSWAIWNGHRDIVEMLLDNGASVNTTEFGAADPFRRSPLFWAICNGSESQLLQLLSHDMQVSGGAAIELAKSEGHHAIVQLLLNRNPVVATQGAIPALFRAIIAGEERVVDEILEHGFSTEILHDNWTPLTLAAKKGCFAIVQRLLNQVSPNVRDGEGRTALIVAASCGFADILKVLIEHGANVNITNNGWTALQRVAYDGHDRMVKLLLEHRADIEGNTWFPDTGTPLMLASLKGHLAIVRLLLELDANVHARNSHGETALMVGARYYDDRGLDEKVAVASLLLEHGADIDARSHDGFTPIIMASRAGYTNLVRLLLSKNANIDIRDCKRRSALDWSVDGRHWEIEQMLMEQAHWSRVPIPDF